MRHTCRPIHIYILLRSISAIDQDLFEIFEFLWKWVATLRSLGTYEKNLRAKESLT